jgi:hypothetical protein
MVSLAVMDAEDSSKEAFAGNLLLMPFNSIQQ